MLVDVSTKASKLIISSGNSEHRCKDKRLFIPEKIVKHKWGKNKKLLFLVHWFNCSNEEDTWEPYTANKNNLIFREYFSRTFNDKSK